MSTTVNVRRACVLGAGTMGQGIAQVAAAHAIEARLYDSLAGRAEEAKRAIAGQLEKLVAKGKMTREAAEETLARVHPAHDVGTACSGVDLVVEAIPENMELKVALFTEVAKAAPKEAILGSNTSRLSLTELGMRTGQAPRTVGLHFFNPPPVMELLEIVRGLATSRGHGGHSAFALPGASARRPSW